MSDNPTSLHKSLNDFVNYCQEWKLEINIDETKAMTFGARKNRNSVLKIGITPLENVSSYEYLGCNFAKSGSFLTMRRHLVNQAKSGSFLTMRRHLVNQANKALHLLYKRLYNLHLPFDLAIKLLDHTIVPILTYSCEVWGYEDLALIERVHCNFLRKLFKLRKSIPLYILYEGTGRYPLSIFIKPKIIRYWLSLLKGDPNKSSFKLYKCMLNTPTFESKWVKNIKSILIETGNIDLWEQQDTIHSLSIKNRIIQTPIDQNQQHWHSQLEHSNKG